MNRSKGVRAIELAPQGKAFIPLAEKWRMVWRESRELGNMDRDRTFHIGSVGSVSTYLLSMALERFMEQNPDCPLNFHHCHSLESYGYVERDELDLALVSDDMFSQNVMTVPAFRGRMVLVTSLLLEETPGPLNLDPVKEIRLPWNPEYDMWHDYWYGPEVRPRVMLDQMSLMEHFLREKDSWVIAPEYIARKLAADKWFHLYGLKDGPLDAIIYYLVKKGAVVRLRGGFPGGYATGAKGAGRACDDDVERGGWTLWCNRSSNIKNRLHHKLKRLVCNKQRRHLEGPAVYQPSVGKTQFRKTC